MDTRHFDVSSRSLVAASTQSRALAALGGLATLCRTVMKEDTMSTRFARVKQTIALVGLILALVATAATPLLGAHGVEAARNGRKASANDVTAEAIKGFSSTGGVAIADNQAASPYPSTIQVSGFETPVTHVAIAIHQFSHTWPNDVDMLLVGPQGQTAIFWSDLGGAELVNGVTLTFDDRAANFPPQPLTTGTFKPLNNNNTGLDNFPSPAPQQLSNNAALSIFNGTDPNGTWSLYVMDQGTQHSGSFNRWSLLITTANGAPKAKDDSFRAKAGKQVIGPSVLGNDSDPDDDALTAILADQPKKGSVSLQPDGSFTYKAKKKAKGQDSFTYLAQDPDALNDLATVTIQIKKGKKKKGNK
jgi:subtilisin-like proprotein convertase family protein